VALDAELVVGPLALPAMCRGDVEVCWAWCEHRARHAPDDHDPADGRFRGLTVLVSFATDSEDRAAIRSLRHLLAFADCRMAAFSGADWPNRLCKRFAGLHPDFVSAAIYVGSNADLVAETVQSAVDALRACFGATLAAVIVLGGATGKLASLRGVSGFVVGAHATSGDTARAVFLTLAMLMAPATLCPIDVEDLSPVLGTADAPARLVQAFWLRNGDGRLVHLHSGDLQAVRSAGQVLAVPLCRGFRLAELRSLYRQICSYDPAAAQPVIFAAVNPLRLGAMPANAGLVLLICKTAAMADTTSTINHRRQAIC